MDLLMGRTCGAVRERLVAELNELILLVIEAMEEHGRDEISERMVQALEASEASHVARLGELSDALRFIRTSTPGVRALLISGRLPLK